MKKLIAAAAGLLLSHAAGATSWELVAGAPIALHPERLEAPRGIAVGADDTVYFTDGANVRALRNDGKVVALPGHFIAPAGLAVAADGTVFVADAGNHVVKAIAPTGDVRTVAGQAGTAGRNDGKGIAAHFDQPAGLALDGAGSLLVADTGNRALRKIAANGAVSTLALHLPLQPQGVALDARGGAIVYDASSALRIGADGKPQALEQQPAPPQPRMKPQAPAKPQDATSAQEPERRASAIAEAEGECLRGKCLRRFQAPSMPVPENARAMPAGQMAADAQGRLLASVPAAGTIYRIERNGMIAPLLGTGDVTGELSGAARDREGRLYVLLAEGQSASSWDAAGNPRPFALQYAASLNRDGPALQARFGDITQLAVGRDGGLYVLDGDQLRRIDKEGVVRTLQEEGRFRKLSEERTAAQVDLHGAMAARSSTGVFVTANGALAGVSTEGLISLVSGPPGMAPEQTGLVPALRRIWAYVSQDAEPFMLPGLGQHRIAADASGQAWYCADSVLWRIRPRGVARKTVLQGDADGCGDVVVAPTDDVFMLHGQYMTRVGGDGYQWLVAGSRERKGSADGAGLMARFQHITHAAPDAGNNIFLLDDGMLRKLSAQGEVTTEAKDLFKEVGKLRALAVDRKGVLYVATQHSVLRVKP
jgi:sugar lactone lactonase YvrE